MTTYLPNLAYAKKELARLHGIRAYLANRIIECQTVFADHKYSAVWVKEYKARLRDNVWPAIKECEAYIASKA